MSGGNLDDPKLDPFEINFLPQFREGRGDNAPFINSYGVLIGDHEYESDHSPLQNWSVDTDPAVMAGDEWVHPFKDIGFHSPVNREWFEEGLPPHQEGFTHPEENVVFGIDEPSSENESKIEQQPK
ncbi:DUF3905 domain-containing protein [Paenibacillus sp. GSMTC-2017]|uniref:DUF3905 domain-containing protein n=1 Tax=Paenibacillus sp. GSMTC-2017 TaxID=2794350 RepID=UPI0018D8AD0F|nr:DUF3905 domain-containing protein [Paenibacillus sp. GSMTC-2017]